MDTTTADFPHSSVTVLGIGGAGGRTVAALNRLTPPGRIRLLAVDTDRAALEATGLPEENRMLAAAEWRGGMGCGGDVIAGQGALARERKNLEKWISGTPLLLVTGALGGGTATGGAGVVLSVCRKCDVPTIFLLTLPFTLEGHSKRRIAETALRNELLEVADAVLTLPNDLLFSVLPAETPLAEAFQMADRELAGTALALTAMLGQGSLLAPDFGDLVTLLRHRKSYCSIGVGTASDEDPGARGQTALERMLQSPLLGGPEKLAGADAVMLSLIGGPELSIGETKRLLELAAGYVGGEARIVTGASVEPAFAGRLQLCALAVKFDEAEQPAAAHPARKAPARRAAAENAQGELDFEQQTLPLNTMSKGAMEKTTQVIWNREDLDYPTFQRRSVVIDTGKLLNPSDLK